MVPSFKSDMSQGHHACSQRKSLGMSSRICIVRITHAVRSCKIPNLLFPIGEEVVFWAHTPSFELDRVPTKYASQTGI